MPCQTCVSFQTECVYDRTQDRRSKAYFQKRLDEGVREAVESDNVDGVRNLLQRNRHFNDVSSDLQHALKFAEDARMLHHKTPSPKEDEPQPLAPSMPVKSSLSTSTEDVVCVHECALDGPINVEPQLYFEEAQKRQERLLEGPDYQILPYIINDDSPFSLAFSNFRNAVTHMRSHGTSMEYILGPLETHVELLFRTRQADDPFTSCTWACEMARIYAHIDFNTQLANAFLLSRYMRWILAPTQDNYILVPDLIKPTKLQRTVPHFASADLYSLPIIRDTLIKGERTLSQTIGPADTWGLRFEWPFDLEKAVDRHPVTGAMTISRLFAACASDEKYWHCSADFLVGFPEAKGNLNVIKHEHGWTALDSPHDAMMVDGE